MISLSGRDEDADATRLSPGGGWTVGALVDAFFGSSGTSGATNNWIAFSGTAAGPSQDVAFVVLSCSSLAPLYVSVPLGVLSSILE